MTSGLELLDGRGRRTGRCSSPTAHDAGPARQRKRRTLQWPDAAHQNATLDSTPPPSGEQVELRHGPWSAVVVEVGGGLRSLARGRRCSTATPSTRWLSGGRGQASSPGRTGSPTAATGVGGREIEAPVNERSTSSAIHGLARWSAWRVTDARRRAARWSCACPAAALPVPARPAARVRPRRRRPRGDAARGQRGDTDLPVGAGFHPVPHARDRDDRRPARPGARRGLAADRLPRHPHRRAPPGVRRPRPARGPALGARVLDHCLTDLARDGDGLARVRLAAPDGRRGDALDGRGLRPFVMVFTGDTLEPARAGAAWPSSP